MSTYEKLCKIEITFRQDYWIDTDQIRKNNFNDKTYDLRPIDMVFMLKIYQEEDFDFLDHEGTKFNIENDSTTSNSFNFGYRLWSFEFCCFKR